MTNSLLLILVIAVLSVVGVVLLAIIVSTRGYRHPRPRTVLDGQQIARMALPAKRLTRCRFCKNAVKSDWLFCPQCRSAILRQCPNCKQRLAIQQLKCRSCKRPIAPFLGQEAEGALAMRWSFFAHLWGRFYSPFEAVLSTLEEEARNVVRTHDLTRFLDSCEALPLKRAAREAIQHLATTPTNRSVALRLWVRYAKLLGDGDAILQPIEKAYFALQSAVQRARAAGFADKEISGSLKSALGDFATRQVTARSCGLLADSVLLGSSLFVRPVVSVSLWLGAKQEQQRKIEQHLTQLSYWLAEVRVSIFRTFQLFWESLGEDLLNKYGLKLGGPQFIEKAWADWNTMKENLPHGSNIQSLSTRLEECNKYIEKWGPQPEAVNEIIALYLTPELYNQEQSLYWSRTQRKLFACYADTFKKAIEIALDNEQFEDSLKYVTAGLKQFADDGELQLLLIEALAANREIEDASARVKAAVKQDASCEAHRHFARGLARINMYAEAAKAVQEWIKIDGAKAYIGMRVRSDLVLRGLIKDGHVSFPSGLEEEICAILEKHLKLHRDATICISLIDAKRRRNLTDTFVNIKGNERILFLWDFGVFFRNGTTGLVITNRRVMWKEWLAADKVQYRLSDVAPNEVRVEEMSLVIRRSKVQMVYDKSEVGKLDALADSLREIVVHLKARPKVADVEAINNDSLQKEGGRDAILECPHGHGPLREFRGEPRCWTCGWTQSRN